MSERNTPVAERMWLTGNRIEATVLNINVCHFEVTIENLSGASIMRNQHRNQKRRGAALVEMAIVLPVFFAVVLGIVEFGRALMVGQMVNNAAREGARLAIVDGTANSDVTSRVKDFLLQSANINGNDVTVNISVTAATGNNDPGNQLLNAQTKDMCTISVAVPFTKVSYITGNYLEGKSLAGSSTMRHE